MPDTPSKTSGWTLEEARREAAGTERWQQIEALAENPRPTDRRVVYAFRDAEADERERRARQDELRLNLDFATRLLRAKLETGEWELTGIPRGKAERKAITDPDILKALRFDFRKSTVRQGGLRDGRHYDFVRVHPRARKLQPRRPGPKPSARMAIRQALEALPRDLVSTGSERDVFEAANEWLHENGLPQAKLESDSTRPNQTFRRALSAYLAEHDQGHT